MPPANTSIIWKASLQLMSLLKTFQIQAVTDQYDETSFTGLSYVFYDEDILGA
jgi:hypothetical protein